MNRSTLHPLLVVLMLSAVWPARAAAQAIVVEVDNDARIPAADLAQVEAVVARSYVAIGVQVIWEYREVPLDDPRGLRVHLRLLSRTSGDRKITRERIGRAVLAQTNRPARLVYVFVPRIVDASVKFAHNYTHILGLVLAHELGHVLLPAGSHSDTGVMKGRANLWAKMAHEFTPDEGEAIRAMLQDGKEARSDSLRQPKALVVHRCRILSMSGTARRLHYSYAQYVALEEESPIRHEYLDGEIYAMAGGSPDHAALAATIIRLLGSQVRSGCRAFTSDLRVRIPSTGLSTYPDVAVVCGRTQRAPDDVLAVVNPVLLVEITSDSTEEYDRGEKLRHYQQLSSLRHIVVVSHREPRLTLYSREEAEWVIVEAWRGQTVALAGVGARLSVDEVYRDELEDVRR